MDAKGTARTDIVIFGLGAIGAYYAYVFSRSPEVRLDVVARSNFEQVQQHGLDIRSEIHGSHRVLPHRVLRFPDEAEQTYDYVVCTNKAIGQDKIAASLGPLVGRNTTLVIIQNGVGNEEPFRRAFPDNAIITCVTWVGASQPSSGVVKHNTSEHTQVGLFRNPNLEDRAQDERLEKFVSFLRLASSPFDVEADMQLQRWKKVVWNIAWNAITSLTLVDTHTWLATENGLHLTRRLMKEAITVAQKSDVPLQDGLMDELIEKILKMPPIYSSMHADRVAGKQMELDMILGSPVRKARELGLDTPIMDTLYSLLVALNKHLE